MTTTSDSALEKEIHIKARPETIFPFFTDPLKMVRWIGLKATLEPRPGGIYRVDMNGKDIANGEYIEITPYSRVVFSWGWEEPKSMLPPGSSIVEVTLTPDQEGTTVKLRHSKLTADQQEHHSKGWDHFLLRLVEIAEGRDPGPDPWAM